MARIRSIKPEYFTDGDVGELPPLVRLLFVAMWCHADKSGRMKDKPRTIKAQCLPFDELGIDDALAELESAGFIVRYVVDGVGVIQIRTWDQHQRPHHTEQDSRLPDQATTVQEPLNNGATTENARDAAQRAPSPMTRNKKQETKNKKPERPTPEQVVEYAQSIGFELDGHQFVSYYEANGWKVGRNSMKCWKAAVRTWKSRQKSNTKPDPLKELGC